MSRLGIRIGCQLLRTWTGSSHCLPRPGSLFQFRSLNYKTRAWIPGVDGNKVAVSDANGEHSYDKLNRLATAMSTYIRSNSVRGSRVGILMAPGLQYVAGIIGAMHANCVPVPLNWAATDTELEYVLNDSETSVVLTSPETDGLIADGIANFCFHGYEGQNENGIISYDDLVGGLMIYTSGTTGNPKGALSGYRAFRQWTKALTSSWNITLDDRILHTLPLYHVHGILGVFSHISVGATVDMRHRFNPEIVWNEFLGDNPPTVYFGVPTQYAKLISHFDAHLSDKDVKDSFTKIRLMVSGSAALRVPVSDRWQEMTGHRLLERYGMTEVGLILSNPLHPSAARTPGSVGLPFPGVEVRVVNDSGDVLAQAKDGHVNVTDCESGELQVKGDTLFTQYFNRPAETEACFTGDGWFKTGDTVDVHNGAFRILGRTNSDILKSGGYKISALEIERELVDSEVVTEVAVIGVADDTWGDKIVAVVESNLESQQQLDLADLKSWCQSRLSPYKVPKEFILISGLPRNHMGKVNKKNLVKMYPNFY